LVVGNGDEALPNATLTDWKSYGDAIAAIDVAAERSEPTPREVAETGEGLINRTITVRVTRIYWRAVGSRPTPATFDMLAWGWVVHDRRRTPTVSSGSPRLEVGHRYLVALLWFRGGWTTLGSGAEMPFDGGVVGRGEWEGRDPARVEAVEHPAITSLLGARDPRIQSTLAHAHADPLADSLRRLAPLARYQRVNALHEAHSS
jgi:hypothetical protein